MSPFNKAIETTSTSLDLAQQNPFAPTSTIPATGITIVEMSY